MTTPIFYDDRMSVSGVESFSQSASKPARFIKLMQHHDFRSYNPDGPCLHPVTPVTKEDLYRAHAKEYIDGLFGLTIPNGFDNYDPRIPESCLWTIGALLGASRWAMQHPHTPTCAPVSGYHHAGYCAGGGFCSINGLMVVCAILIAENPDLRIGIIDADDHEGNGTNDILRHLPWLDKQVLHFTAGQHFHGDNPTEEALEFQEWLHHSIDMVNAFKPGLVLYQAGADSHIDDNLQGGYLTTEQMVQRDRMVFRGINAPLCFNLAGGYQHAKDGTIHTDPVLRIHHNTLLESNASAQYRHQLGATS